MAGERVDLALPCADRRMARRAGGDALLPAQDKEDEVPGAVLEHCVRVAGRVVEFCVR